MLDNGANIKNVAIYTRVSTEDQAKGGFSLEAQLEKLRAYCVALDYNVVGEYIEEGESGRTIKRPQYEKMFEDIDKWDGILVMKLDRIHRSRLNMIVMMDQLKNQDKNFVSMTESLNTSTAMGRFVMGIISEIAQLESEQIGERTFIAMKQKAKQKDSGFMGHCPPFGYKAIIESTGETYQSGKKKTRCRLEPIPEEIQLVKKCFELYAQGLSQIRVSEKLKIKLCQVQYWLSNTWYAGYEQWLNHFKKAPVEPIISVELWNRVQQMKVSKPCGSAKHKPFLIQEGVESFDLSHEEMEEMKAYHHRPKHNLSY